jgi:exosortase H (IPTLxxWG-CTERM-specific)
MLRFGALFAALVVALFALELTPPAQVHFVGPWTAGVAKTATAAMKAFDPAVVSSGPTVMSTANGFAVTILAGCNGVEAMIVLVAAMLAFPAPWKHRALGILAGIVAIQALNLVRIVSLFYIGQWDRDVFEWAHLYAWQVLVMIDGLVVWLVWLRTLPRPEPAAHVAAIPA